MASQTFQIFSRWGTPLGSPGLVLSAVRTQSLDGTDTLDLTSEMDMAKGDRIVWRTPTGAYREWIVQSSDVTRGSRVPMITVHAVDAIAELEGHYLEDVPARRGASSRLVDVLNGTRWSVGGVGLSSNDPADQPFYHTNSLAAVQRIANDYSLEIETEYLPTTDGGAIGTRRIHLKARRGSTTGVRRFEYSRDLVSVRRTIDASNVITRLYAWGKTLDGSTTERVGMASVNNGKNYVEDPQATEAWGIPGPDGTKQPTCGDIIYDKVEAPLALLILAKGKLMELTQPRATYKATVAAMARAGEGIEGVQIGDTVQVIDTAWPQPLRMEARVLEIEEDLVADLSEATITLGNLTSTLLQRSEQVQQAITDLTTHTSAWDDAASLGQGYLDALVTGLNGVLNATGGYVYLKQGQGIYVYDKPEDQSPTQCVQIGGGYIRIADSKTSAGEWNFRTLSNGHGIVADSIVSGTLSGITIKTIGNGKARAELTQLDNSGGGLTLYNESGKEYAHVTGSSTNDDASDGVLELMSSAGLNLQATNLYVNGTPADGIHLYAQIDGLNEGERVNPDSRGSYRARLSFIEGADNGFSLDSAGHVVVKYAGWYDISAVVNALRTTNTSQSTDFYYYGAIPGANDGQPFKLGGGVSWRLEASQHPVETWVSQSMPTSHIWLSAGSTVWVGGEGAPFVFGSLNRLDLFKVPMGNVHRSGNAPDTISA